MTGLIRFASSDHSAAGYPEPDPDQSAAYNRLPGPGGNSATNWTDPRTGNDYEVLHDSTNGTSIAWLSTYLVNRVLTWKTVEADYSDHGWFVSVMHAAGPIQGSTAGATSTVMTPAEI
jgi:hypothetical protein